MMRCRAVLLVCLLAMLTGCVHDPSGRVAFEPMRVIETVQPEYPPEMASRGITEGEVWITIAVDPDGRLIDRLLTAYSRASFARSAIEALHQWQFKPARVAGVPVSTRQEFHFTFNLTGQIISRSGPEAVESQMRALQTKQELTVLVAREHELDESLQVDKEVPVEWPVGAPANLREARVTVDYFIDGYGRTRLIAVKKSDGDVFSEAAVIALMQRRYRAPLRYGEPTLVHRIEEFIFTPPS
jgi:TonB family protein